MGIKGGIIMNKFLPIAQEHTKNEDWFRENFEELQRKYGGKIVTILGQNIYCVAHDISDHHKKIKRLSRLDKRRAYTEHIPKKKVKIVKVVWNADWVA